MFPKNPIPSPPPRNHPPMAPTLLNHLHSSLMDPSISKVRVYLFLYDFVFGVAWMSDEEFMQMVKPGEHFVTIFCKGLRVKTTRSWEFLGLDQNGAVPSNSLWNKTLGEVIIITNIDTRVWPDSESFRDDGVGSILSKWKGRCSDGEDWIKCNKKLISEKVRYR